jgi:PAS domain S-box-containing protein
MVAGSDDPRQDASDGRIFRALVDASPDIIVLCDSEGAIRFVNDAVTRVLGYSPEELIGRPVSAYFHPGDVERATTRIREVLEEKHAGGRTGIYRLRRKDGGYRSLETLSDNRLDDPGIRGLIVVARDVTERVAAESARLAVHERRQLAARIARVGIFEWNVQTNELLAEEPVRELVRQWPGQRWTGPLEFLDRFLPEDRAAVRQALEGAIRGDTTCRVLGRIPLADGSVRWVYLYAQRLPGQDPPSPWVFGLIVDMTEQKLAEQEMQRRGELLEMASWGADLGIWTWFPVEGRAIIDERGTRLLGLAPGGTERPADEYNSRVHPDDLPELTRLEDELVAGRRDVFDCAYRVQRDGPGWHWLLDRGRVNERGPDGRATRVSGITLDIDEAKGREHELEEQRLRLGLALRASRLGLWDYDAIREEMFVDERYTEITGLRADEVRWQWTALRDRIHEEDRPRLVAASRDCLQGRARDLEFEGRLLDSEGRLSWVRIEGFVPRQRADGTAARVIGTIADVTERRRVSQLSQVGERVIRIGSYEYDVGAERFYWSEGTYRVFEMPDDFVPVRGSTIGMLTPRSRATMSEVFRAALESGREFDIEAEVVTARSRRVWVRILGRVETFQGRPVRIYGIVQDITERKQLEAALLEAANLEQQKLGRELHDGLGQELTGISLLLQGMAPQVKASNPALAQPFDRLSALLSAAIASTRRLAHGLAPVSSGRGGLAGALRVLASQVTAGSGIPVSVEDDPGKPVVLSEVAGSHLYRIAQEALNNAVRHGEAARIVVRLHTDDEQLRLEVEDDGRGIPQPASSEAGMGLRSMKYRAQSLGGALVVGAGRDGGTRVVVTMPWPEA